MAEIDEVNQDPSILQNIRTYRVSERMKLKINPSIFHTNQIHKSPSPPSTPISLTR